jgi:hypothetical protein
MRKRDELTNPDSCLNRAREDEWIFSLLGRDEDTPATVRYWIEKRIARGKNIRGDAQMAEAEALAQAVETEHRCGLKSGQLYRVTAGEDKGALVRFHFVNVSGNADCRLAEDFGPHKAGAIFVVKPEDLASSGQEG